MPPWKDPVATLQYLLGPLPKLMVSGHLLGVQLMSTNAYLHTSILYGQWEKWNGNSFDEPPLFYNGLTESAANLLSSVSEEVLYIAEVIKKEGADLSQVGLRLKSYKTQEISLVRFTTCSLGTYFSRWNMLDRDSHKFTRSHPLTVITLSLRIYSAFTTKQLRLRLTAFS